MDSYTMVDPDLMVVGGYYDTPDEALHWASFIPDAAPPVELAVADPQ